MPVPVACVLSHSFSTVHKGLLLLLRLEGMKKNTGSLKSEVKSCDQNKSKHTIVGNISKYF